MPIPCQHRPALGAGRKRRQLACRHDAVDRCACKRLAKRGLRIAPVELAGLERAFGGLASGEAGAGQALELGHAADMVMVLVAGDDPLDVRKLDEYNVGDAEALNVARLRQVWEHTRSGCSECESIVRALTQLRESVAAII